MDKHRSHVRGARPHIALSGGFDPLHSGHMAMIADAQKYGRVVVLLNSDAWLVRKKGYALLPYEDRAAVLDGLEGVYCVVRARDDDGTVCESLRELTPKYFGNGGDRGQDNTPEMALCLELGIEPVHGLGGGKTQSSSALMQRAMNSLSPNQLLHGLPRGVGLEVVTVDGRKRLVDIGFGPDDTLSLLGGTGYVLGPKAATRLVPKMMLGAQSADTICELSICNSGKESLSLLLIRRRADG